MVQGRGGHHVTTKNNEVGVLTKDTLQPPGLVPKAASSKPSSSRNASRKYKLTAKVLIEMN